MWPLQTRLPSASSLHTTMLFRLGTLSAHASTTRARLGVVIASVHHHIVRLVTAVVLRLTATPPPLALNMP